MMFFFALLQNGVGYFIMRLIREAIFMPILVVALLVVILSLDCFSVMLEKGAVVRYLSPFQFVSYALIFSLIACMMLMIGNTIASLLEFQRFINFNPIIYSIIFGVTGTYLLYRSIFKNHFEERLDESISYKTIIKLALVTSIDYFVLGIGLCLSDMVIYLEFFLGFVITFITVILALKIGMVYGARFQKQLKLLLGVVFYILALVCSL